MRTKALLMAGIIGIAVAAGVIEALTATRKREGSEEKKKEGKEEKALQRQSPG